MNPVHAASRGGARRQPIAQTGVISTAAERLHGSSTTTHTAKGRDPE
jgi:hypothetical protein